MTDLNLGQEDGRFSEIDQWQNTGWGDCGGEPADGWSLGDHKNDEMWDEELDDKQAMPWKATNWTLVKWRKCGLIGLTGTREVESTRLIM